MTSDIPPDSSRKRREVFHVAIIIALAALLRLVAAGLRKDYLGFDESMYIVLGKNLLSGSGFTLNGLPNVTFPFGMPLLAGAFLKIAGSARWAVSLPTVIFGSLTVIPLYIIARDIWGRLSGLTAAMLFAGFPALLFLIPYCPYAKRLYAGSEAVFGFFIISAACVFTKALKGPSPSLGLALGFFAGTAFQVRQDALGYIAAFLVMLYLFAAVRDRKTFHAAALKTVLAAAVVFALLAAPHVLWVKHVTGRCSLGPRFPKTFKMRDSLDKVVRYDRWDDALMEYFRPNEDNSQLEAAYYGVAPYHRAKFQRGAYTVTTGEVIRGLRLSQLPSAWHMLWRVLMPRGAWIFVLVGLGSALVERKWRVILLPAALSVPTAFVAMALYVQGRFYIVFAVGLLLLGARGVDICARRAVELLGIAGRSAKASTAICLGIPLAIALWGAYGTLARAHGRRQLFDRYERRTEMQLVELVPLVGQVIPPGARLVAWDPLFEAKLPVTWLAFPKASPAKIAEYCRKRKADFVISRPGDGHGRFSQSQIIEALGPDKIVLDRVLSGDRYILFDLRAPRRQPENP